MVDLKLVLTNQSDENSIRLYFEKVLELSKSGEPFPIELDIVWNLVYSEKGRAVKTLKENFFENSDYLVFDQKVNNLKGGRPMKLYMLSVSCMEYFIARKVRAVFEVYRKVFHKKTESLEILSQASLILQSIQALKNIQQTTIKHDEQLQIIESKIESIEKKQEIEIKQDYFTILAFCKINHIHLPFSEAIKKGKLAAKLSREKGLDLRQVPDEKYGYVFSYKESVLHEVFSL